MIREVKQYKKEKIRPWLGDIYHAYNYVIDNYDDEYPESLLIKNNVLMDMTVGFIYMNDDTGIHRNNYDDKYFESGLRHTTNIFLGIPENRYRYIL